jgi:hypothetical protein
MIFGSSLLRPPGGTCPPMEKPCSTFSLTFRMAPASMTLVTMYVVPSGWTSIAVVFPAAIGWCISRSGPDPSLRR